MATVENVNIEINQKLLDELAALKAENERLKLENEATGDLARIWANKNDELEAENERLKEVNERLTKACNSIQASRNEMDELWKQLQADKAELLEALKSCKQETMYQSSGYARNVYITQYVTNQYSRSKG